MVEPYGPAVERRIMEMRAEYRDLLQNDRRWSLRTLFSTADYDIADYCAGFRPNRYGTIACAEVESFCRRHGIWLTAGGAQYNSMTPYLHPAAITADRMTTIGIVNAILFWLNDTVGREKFPHLTSAAKTAARRMVLRLGETLETGCTTIDSTPEVHATAELRARLTHDADHTWLDRFTCSTIAHLSTAIRDQNARARGGVPTVTEYIGIRTHVSGMYPAIALCEFARDDYLRWNLIRAAGLGAGLDHLRELTVQIGALMNDVFSFEKECIVDRADFNLVAIFLLNNPGWTLADAIHGAAELVCHLLTDFRRTHARLILECDRHRGEPARAVRAHADDLVGCAQATWVWQTTTSRYRGNSIFIENTGR
ncbi:terpene synthase family protein [Nocardia brasiliensis]|uniref:terpene synthase family protein n=1 Tax=Nocardia brasiliensis TaxID=37326 RepID=UPI00245904E5|nr:terpene synthase [Nocardia brasiliensis]